MKKYTLYTPYILLAFIFLLILLCIFWESLIAPIRVGGSWLILKMIPLLFPFFAILKDKNNRKNYQRLSLIIQLYLLESLVRITDKFPVNYLAIIELICSIVIFILLVLQLRSLKNN